MSIKSLGSVRFKKKKLTLLFSMDALNWLKMTVKSLLFQKKYFPLNFLFIKEILKEQNVAWFPQNYEAT